MSEIKKNLSALEALVEDDFFEVVNPADELKALSGQYSLLSVSDRLLIKQLIESLAQKSNI